MGNVSCYVPRGTKGTAQLLSLAEFKSHLLEVSILLAQPLTNEDDIVSRAQKTERYMKIYMCYSSPTTCMRCWCTRARRPAVTTGPSSTMSHGAAGSSSTTSQYLSHRGASWSGRAWAATTTPAPTASCTWTAPGSSTMQVRQNRQVCCDTGGVVVRCAVQVG